MTRVSESHHNHRVIGLVGDEDVASRPLRNPVIHGLFLLRRIRVAVGVRVHVGVRVRVAVRVAIHAAVRIFTPGSVCRRTVRTGSVQQQGE